MYHPADDSSPRSVVDGFFRDIRTGERLTGVGDYMAASVIAHQVCSEEPMAIVRTASEYAEQLREMIDACSDFRIDIDQMIAEGDRVYVRWTQHGTFAIENYDGHVVPTDLAEFGSAVYRVADGKIVEYWIQVDRTGTQAQVERAREFGHAHFG